MAWWEIENSGLQVGKSDFGSELTRLSHYVSTMKDSYNYGELLNLNIEIDKFANKQQ